MVERDGGRDTAGAVTSDVDAVPPAARLCTHPTTPLVMCAAVGMRSQGRDFWIAAACMMLALFPPRPTSSGPIACTSLDTGTFSPRTALFAVLTTTMECASGWWIGEVAVSGIGGDRTPAKTAATMTPQLWPPAWASGRRRRPPAPHIAKLGAHFGRLADALFVCRWVMPTAARGRASPLALGTSSSVST